MRSAGVIMNDLADRSFDGQVERTRHRPLVSGQLHPKHALGLLAILLIAATGLLWFLNPLTWLLSPMALLLAGLYPFCKRILHIPQLILGVAFGWGGVMAWAAVRNELETGTWLLFAATVCWAIVYDTIYAIQDREDDRKIGVKSSAILFGSYTWLGVGLAGFFMLSFLVASWADQPFGNGILCWIDACSGSHGLSGHPPSLRDFNRASLQTIQTTLLGRSDCSGLLRIYSS